MHPEFRDRVKDRRGEPTSIRLPDNIRRALGFIGEAEEDSVAGLLLEGALRVIDNRKNDPDFTSTLESRLQTKLTELQTDIADTQEALRNNPLNGF